MENNRGTAVVLTTITLILGILQLVLNMLKTSTELLDKIKRPPKPQGIASLYGKNKPKREAPILPPNLLSYPQSTHYEILYRNYILVHNYWLDFFQAIPIRQFPTVNYRYRFNFSCAIDSLQILETISCQKAVIS